MLPFLQPKKLAGVIVATHKPSGEMQDDHMEGEESPHLISAMEDFIRAVHMKNAEDAATAFHAACMLCDQDNDEPGEE